MTKKSYYFCGIGGNGMSPLARLLAARGFDVQGSDRSFDSGRNLPFFDQLHREGVKLVLQDGSAVTASIDTFVVTRAVEESIPDIGRARQLNLNMLKRPQLMAELFADTENIAVGGTSGKSTTTGMVGHILATLGRSPTIMNGAIMLNSGTNFVNGASELAVFEADESDGHQDVVGLCPSSVAVLTNISLDHFELSELNDIFATFIKKATIGAVLNADCPNSMSLRSLVSRAVTFGEGSDADISGTRLNVHLGIPGKHNRANALAAVAACSLLGIDAQESLEALKSFRGIKRRLEVIGTAKGVRVVDDFASNPGKIGASVETLQSDSARLFVVFQPHGFQPTKMMKDGYIDTFSTLLRPQDVLVMPDIYYVVGTANIVDGKVVPISRDISSKDVVDLVAARGREAHYLPSRPEVIAYLTGAVKPGDTIGVMGSRDETLSDFAAEILAAIER
jgi:UDP-N-acetylmuramate--alanine ligase